MRVQNTEKNNLIIGPAVAVDILIFTVKDEKLKILLIQIGSGVYKNKWALPGGIVQLNETLDQAAINVLRKKAGLQGVYMEQLYTFGDLDRDIRGRTISVSYFALVNSDGFKLETTNYYSDIKWINVKKMPKLAFDHKKIINYGLLRLRRKLEYTNIAYGLLAEKFTLTELQKVYQIVLDKQIDKRNFRKHILSLDIIVETKKIRTGKKHRPAKLYKFKDKKLIFTK